MKCYEWIANRDWAWSHFILHSQNWVGFFFIKPQIYSWNYRQLKNRFSFSVLFDIACHGVDILRSKRLFFEYANGLAAKTDPWEVFVPYHIILMKCSPVIITWMKYEYSHDILCLSHFHYSYRFIYVRKQRRNKQNLIVRFIVNRTEQPHEHRGACPFDSFFVNRSNICRLCRHTHTHTHKPASHRSHPAAPKWRPKARMYCCKWAAYAIKRAMARYTWWMSASHGWPRIVTKWLCRIVSKTSNVSTHK